MKKKGFFRVTYSRELGVGVDAGLPNSLISYGHIFFNLEALILQMTQNIMSRAKNIPPKKNKTKL